ncbi:hypothetical protein T05_705 [Trichinella murrelli]|uniref:Uncharacterized protein n=1 Tax=Trichinella murrelli TaxID=144512 RepID=A0A0V0U5T0_9BILA|nr:hypothetical protein T05_705 [Trichinella murrelli]
MTLRLICEFVCEVIGQSEKGKRRFHGFKPNSGTCLHILIHSKTFDKILCFIFDDHFSDVRLAMAMRNKSASERKCTSRHAEIVYILTEFLNVKVRIDLQQKSSDALKTGFQLCTMEIRIALEVPYCQLMFKEWSKEAVITRATWSKSRTSRSKIREQTLSLNSVRVSWGYFKRVKLYFN